MGVASLDPETGELSWEEPFTGPGGITIADAVQSGSYLLVSGSYTGSMMLRLNLDRPAATALRGRTSPSSVRRSDRKRARLGIGPWKSAH